jgi:translation initiation factor 2 subunit 2
LRTNRRVSSEFRLRPKTILDAQTTRKMSEEPLFDPSLKKKKKKTVAFSQDPSESQPAPFDDHAANGDALDLGPTTVHERTKAGEEKNEDDEFKAMFGDLKKKKKKKEIPLDLVSVS